MATAPQDQQQKLQRMGFDAAAHLLDGMGMRTATFEEARRLAPALVKRVEAMAAESLRRDFHVPADGNQDRASYFTDYRRERLVVREGRDEAVFLPIDNMDDEVAKLFLRVMGDFKYLEVVAMPKAKARALYKVRVGSEHFKDGDENYVVGLRRRMPPAPAYPRGLIMVAVADSATQLKQAVLRFEGRSLIALISSWAYSDPIFVRSWLFSDPLVSSKKAILIDRDPFDYLKALASRARYRLLKTAIQWGDINTPTTTNVMLFQDP